MRAAAGHVDLVLRSSDSAVVNTTGTQPDIRVRSDALAAEGPKLRDKAKVRVGGSTSSSSSAAAAAAPRPKAEDPHAAHPPPAATGAAAAAPAPAAPPSAAPAKK